MGRKKTSGDGDNEVQEGTILARELRLEPENEPPEKKDSNLNVTHTAINAIQSNLPHDLTGQVTKSSTHPLASGGFGDIYKGKLKVGGRLIDVRHCYVFFSGKLNLNYHPSGCNKDNESVLAA